MKKMYYSYVLKSKKDGKMYTGFTKDLKLSLWGVVGVTP